MIFLIFLLSLLFPTRVYASDEFKLQQSIIYEIDNQGNAKVHQDNNLINNYSEIYVKEFQFNISGNELSNIHATDSQGSILENVAVDGQNSIIKVKFNDSNLGKNKITTFNLDYDIKSFAIKKGNTWEVSLPLLNPKQEDDISIELSVPQSFGSLSFSSVTPKNILVLNQKTKIYLDTNTIKNSKVLFVFGNSQVFDLNLKYFLSNTSKNTVKTEIAIPPDTDSQHVIYRLTPQPKNVVIDKDGNWLAQYQLKPQEKIDVLLEGQIKVFPVIPTQKDQISKEDFLRSSNYWPIDDPQIKKIAQETGTPKKIYDYVVSSLSYDYSQIDKAQRKGALSALNSPHNSLCTEFTDLFIAIARAAGIPAREVEGFAYTNNPKIKPTNENTDILHAWPQYFDVSKSKWISVDPTWEKTTNGIDYYHELDLNHISFVFHGINSEYPSPPGSYKNQRNTKTIDINFAKSELKDTYIPPTIEIPKFSFYQNPNMLVTNTNPNMLPKAVITNPKNKSTFEVTNMPPYSQKIIKIPPVGFFESLHPKYQKLNFEVETDSGQKANYSTLYPPHYLNLAISLLTLIFLLSIGGIILTSKKR